MGQTLWRHRAAIAAAVFIGAAAYLLWSEHQAHILGILPYLLLLACPLMHVFMHNGHGGHGGHERERAGKDGARQ